MRDGYSKGLVRQILAQRFPQLGFGRDRKVTASGFYRSVLISEGVEAWKRMGGAQALAELGIVEPAALERHMNGLFRQDDGADRSRSRKRLTRSGMCSPSRRGLAPVSVGSPMRASEVSPIGGVD